MKSSKIKTEKTQGLNGNFQVGNPGNKGGGRKPDWLKTMCQNIVTEKKLVQRYGFIAAGGHVEQMLSDGEIVVGPAPIAAQEKAYDSLVDRGWGKCVQPICGDDEDKSPIKVVFEVVGGES